MRVAWTPARLDGEKWDPVLVHPVMRTARSRLCKAGKHDLCTGVFQSTERDPVAHRASGVLKCSCRCHG